MQKAPLKILLNTLSNYLLTVFCISQNLLILFFSETLKTSINYPIPKSAFAYSDHTNFLPINHLPYLSNGIKRIFKFQHYNFLYNNYLLMPEQLALKLNTIYNSSCFLLWNS